MKNLSLLFVFCSMAQIGLAQKLAPLDFKGKQSSYSAVCRDCSGGFYTVKRNLEEELQHIELKNKCDAERLFLIRLRDKSSQEWLEIQTYVLESGGTALLDFDESGHDAFMIASVYDEECMEGMPSANWKIFMISKVPTDDMNLHEY